MNIEELETHYNYKFSTFYKQLWNDGMLDWMGGRTTPFASDESWEKTIYPQIKEKPPVLLHTGGFDFEMLPYEEMLHFKFDEFVDTKKHKFIPFAKTEEGNIYAFYEGIETDGESAVVYVWDEINETEVLAKNFEDFIFRKMLEAIHDVDKDNLSADYTKEDFELYRIDILKDLETVRPYLSEKYMEVLTALYNKKDVGDGLFSFSLLSTEELKSLITEYLSFSELNSVFEHEIE